MQSPSSTPPHDARAEIARGRDALSESLARNLDATPDGRSAIALLLATIAGLIAQIGDRAFATRLFGAAFRLSPERLYLNSYTALRLVESRAYMLFVMFIGLPSTIVRVIASALASLTRTGIAEMRHLMRTRGLAPGDWVGGLRVLVESLLLVPLAVFTFVLAIVAFILQLASKIAGIPMLPLTPIAVRLLRMRSRRELKGDLNSAQLRELADALRAFTEKTRT